MNILQVVPHYVPAFRFGGPLQVAHSLGKALVNRGHHVTVCTTNLENRSEDLLVPIDQPVDVDGVTVYYESVPFFRRWGYSPLLFNRVNELVPNADIILVHNHFQYSGLVAPLFARKYKKPYIIFPHASLKKQSLSSSSYFAKRAYLSLLERTNFLNASYVAFNASEELADSFFSHKGTVVPNGIDPLPFLSLPPKNSFRSLHPQLSNKSIFLFLGRLDISQKSLDIVLEAFSKHVSLGFDSHLVLAGPSEGGDYRKIKHMISSLGLSHHVLITGLISGIEKYQLLRDADVFLLPSRSEGLSMSLLEAMAAGLPVIVSNRCGLHTQIHRNECGVVVQPTVDSLLPALAMMENPDLRVHYGHNSRDLVFGSYTWSNIASNFETLLQSLIPQ